jgi:hypothetical protein
VCVDDFGPLQPTAVAVIVEGPDQKAEKVTTPVVGLTLVPNNELIKSIP